MVRLVHACAAALLVFAIGLLAAPVAHGANNDPVVLVHGFLGFGPDEFQKSGFNYWGGYGDIAAHMQVYRGPHTVVAAAVSPIASNWDRARCRTGRAGPGAKATRQMLGRRSTRQSARVSAGAVPAMGP